MRGSARAPDPAECAFGLIMDALDAAAGAAPLPQEEAFDRLSHELQHLSGQAATKVLRRLEPLRLSKGAKGRESAKVRVNCLYHPLWTVPPGHGAAHARMLPLIPHHPERAQPRCGVSDRTPAQWRRPAQCGSREFFVLLAASTGAPPSTTSPPPPPPPSLPPPPPKADADLAAPAAGQQEQARRRR